MPEKKEVIFTDVFGEELFRIPSGQNLLIKELSGQQRVLSVHSGSNDLSACIGGKSWDTQQFVRHCASYGILYQPESPRAGDCLDWYELYQLPDVRNTGYCFRSYEHAKTVFNPKDYQRVYAGTLGRSTTNLETLFILHNQDDRPLARRIRSISVSDLIVTHRDGKSQTYYVNSIGFEVLPGVAERLAGLPKTPHPREQER